MSFDNDIKEIRKLVATISGKDSEVYIIYKGTSHGITKPWNIRCGASEINHESSELGASDLVKILKNELKEKIISTERQVSDYKKALGNLDN